MDLSHILYSLGENRAEYQNAVSPPIFQTSNFSFDSVADMRQALTNEKENALYTRGFNPTVGILRKKIAALEHAEDALIFGSGSAAAAAAIISQVNQGDHIVAVAKPDSWTNKLLSIFLPRFGVETTFVDGTNPQHYVEATQANTKLYYMESPNSLTFEMQDIGAIAQIAKEKGIVTVMDNSYASPMNLNPIEWGVDLVFHSSTKYIAGHSDAVSGVLCGSKEKMAHIFQSEFMTLGGIISPNDAWLVMRGLRTLPIRMKQIAESTAKIIDYLDGHSKVRKIHWPFHKDFPQKELAQKYLKNPCGLFSIELEVGSRAEIELFCDSLNAFLLAVSWGGHESLCLPFLAFHDIPGWPDHYVDWRLVRLSVGFESFEYLRDDLEQALARIN